MKFMEKTSLTMNLKLKRIMVQVKREMETVIKEQVQLDATTADHITTVLKFKKKSSNLQKW